MKNFIYSLFFICCVYSSMIVSQPLNNSFEDWTTGDPNDWSTFDIPGLVDAVTQAGSAFNGSWCAKLEVEDIGGGSPYTPLLSTINTTTLVGHPVSVKHGSLHGYYKCNPLGNDRFLVSIAMQVGQSTNVGVGGGVLGAASSWTEFNLPIYYNPGSPDPDNVIILFTVGDTTGGQPTIGSEVYVDYLDLTGPSSVEQISGLPENFSLTQNYPNPFNPSTKIEYSLPEASYVELKVFDILGNEVAVLVSEEQSAGTYRADFSSENLSSGFYIAQLRTANSVKSIKMTLMK